MIINTQSDTSVPADLPLTSPPAQVESDPAAHSTPAIGDAPGEPGVSDRLRQLVRDKTRFEPQDITVHGEALTDQPFLVETTHRLHSDVTELRITGLFARNANDRASKAPFIDAANDIGDRLKVATAALDSRLRDPAVSTTHDAVRDGLFLPATTRYWRLANCSSCAGEGRLACTTCRTTGRETCWQCSGSLFTICLGCGGGGRRACTSCHGMGTVSQSVSRQVMQTTYVNGQPQTHYGTEHHTEQHRCTAYGCSFGQVHCGPCTGTGRVQCPTCHALGTIVCRGCGGGGHVNCSPCDASGQVGDAAWVGVEHTQTHVLVWPEASDVAAVAIGESAPLADLIAQAGGIRWSAQEVSTRNELALLKTRYEGVLPIVHLRVECAGAPFEIVAFGRDRIWHTLDGIIESLLSSDLQALSRALVHAADEGPLASRLEPLLSALGHVTASELNAELVEAALGGETRSDGHPIVSASYAEEVVTSILGSLRQIYTRSAKRLSWRAALVLVAVTFAVWIAGRAWWAGLAGLAGVPVAWALLHRRVRRTLTTALGTASKAERAMRMASMGGRHQVANALVTIPAALLCLGLWVVLPADGPWYRRSTARVVPTTAVAKSGSTRSADAAGAPTDERVTAALVQRDHGNLVAARASLKALADAGETSAYGPYAWMLLRGEGASGQAAPANGEIEALRLSRDGLATHPADRFALTALGLMTAEGWGLPRDVDGGIALLTRAGNSGFGPAMHLLGLYYINVKRNPVKAREWFEKGAALGDPVDTYNLGLMMWNGEGGQRPDHPQAMALWKVAAAKGEPRAKQAVAAGRPQ